MAMSVQQHHHHITTSPSHPNSHAPFPSIHLQQTTPLLPLAPLAPLALADDAVVARMSLMTDEELPCGVGKFLREFWGEGSRFYECVGGWLWGVVCVCLGEGNLGLCTQQRSLMDTKHKSIQ